MAEEGYRLAAELFGKNAADIERTPSNGMLSLGGKKKEDVRDKTPGT